MLFRCLGRKRWLRVSALIGLVWILVWSLSACGRDDPPGQYRDDGYMGITQTNPNLPTNPTHRNYYEYTQVVKRTLQSMAGIKRVQTFANGPDVIVYLELDEGLPAKKREEIRQNAEKSLSYNNPRFDYDVRLRP